MQTTFIDTKKISLLTNLILYISHHYPHTSDLLDKVLTTYLTHTPLVLCSTLDHLFLQIIKRQYIYGSSFSSRNIEDLPKEIHQDMYLHHHEKSQQIYNIQQGQLAMNFVQKQRIKQLIWYNLQTYLYIGAKLKCNKSVKKILSVQGQQWIEACRFSPLFAVLRKSYDQIQRTMKSKMPVDTMINHARLACLQNKILNNPTKLLCDIVLKTYRQALIILQQPGADKKKYLQTMLQYSYALLFFYKYSASAKAISLCQQLQNLQIQYTGVMGRRTKYQSFDTAQLIMKLRDSTIEEKKQEIKNIFEEQLEQEKIQLPNAKQLILKQTERIVKNTDSSKNIQDVKYDEDNILMDVPPYLKQSTQSISSEITPRKQLTILAAIHHMWTNFPKDDLLYQQISTSINTMLLGSSQKKIVLDYGVRFCLLALRSFNEFPRVKNVERALQQLQKLVDQYKSGINNSQQVFALPYQPHLRFIISVGDKLMQVGLSMSAVQLLQQAGIYEQCADALIKRNYKQKALQIIDRLLKEKGQTPRLLCMKGDACKQQSQELYIRAWKISEQKYPRAQKSLGWLYFSQKKYDKAAQSFQKSLIISYYQPSTWFTLGCCYMHINQTKKALRAFGQTICIDDTQGQAWGNMASCYLKQGKIQQAYSTLEKAVKHSYNSWKMWSNLLSVSLRVKQFYKYFECIEKIAKMDHKQMITNEVLGKLTSILAYKLETSNRKMISYHYIKRITLVFKNIAPIMGQMGIYWKNYCLFHQQLIKYHTNLFQHFKQKGDPSDPVPGYTSPQQTQQTFKNQISEIKKRIVESKQTELNMQMCVGWQQNKITGEKVKIVLEEYEKIYEEYSDKSDLNEYLLFIAGVKKKLEFCFSDK